MPAHVLLATDSFIDPAPQERLAIVARWLREAGASVAMATASPNARDSLATAGASGVELIAAPSIGRLPTVSPQVSPYATHLLQAGFVSAVAIGHLVRGWQDILSRTPADLVLADGCPVLSLPVDWRRPVLHVGDGLNLPSSEGLKASNDAGSKARAEDFLRAAIDEAVAEHGGLRNLFELGGADTAIALCLPEFDPLVDDRGRRNFGPLLTCEPPNKPEAASGLVAALSGDPTLMAQVVLALARLDHPLKAYGGAGEASLMLLRQAGKQVDPFGSMDSRAISAAAVVIHNGDLASCEAALVGGRPQIVVPADSRGAWRGRRIAERGLGIVLDSAAEIERLGRYVDRLLADVELSQRCYAWGMAVSEDFARPKRRELVQAIFAAAERPLPNAERAR